MTTQIPNMHCENPLCVDDDCHGACGEKKEDKLCEASEEVYCED